MRKKALVLAGGYPQIHLIKELKARGYYVILADWNENPIAKEYADKFYQESTLEVEKIENIAQKEHVEFIITVCTDQALLTVANVSEKLGLPCYIDFTTAKNVTNKQYMKYIFSKNNIPTAKYIVTDKFNSERIKELSFPMVVKPVDCNSSKGVKKVENLDELKNGLSEAINCSRTKTAIIEEYIKGEEITVDVFVENGKAKILCKSSVYKIKDNEKFVIFRTLNPAKQDVETLIEQIAQRIAEAFNIINAPMLIQLLYDGKELYVVEFSARTGGGEKFQLINEVTGFDVIKAVIDLTEKKSVRCITSQKKGIFTSNTFLYCHNGVFRCAEGFDKLLNQNIISNYSIYKNQGTMVGGTNSSGDRIGCFEVVGKDIDELNKKIDIVNRTIEIIDENGKDILMHSIVCEKL